MPAFPFVGASYTARSVNFDAQECLNLYPEVSGSGNSKSVAMLIGTPGADVVGSLGGLPVETVRGLYRFDDNTLLALFGQTLVIFDANFTPNASAVAISSTNDFCSFADNGSIIMLVTGDYGYFITPSGLVTQISDPDFLGGDRVDFLAGRFVWNKPGTGQFQYTEVLGTDVDALNFQTAEASPDPIVSQIVGFGELWEFGVNSTEVFQPSGDADIPFAKVQGAAMEIGCLARDSVAKIDSSFLWLGRSDEGTGIVWRAVNYQPQRISTHALEFAIASYGDVTDAVAFTYQQEGHSFYVLSFPSADKTWAYDVSTNLWHERAYMDPADGSLHRIQYSTQANFAGRTVVGMNEQNTLLALDLDTYTDYGGQAILRRRACQHLSADLKRQMFKSLQIDMETGVGYNVSEAVDLATELGNPKARLDWSDDGGHTWSNQHEAPMGRVGKYRTRCIWRRLGQSRDRVFRVSITAPVKVCIIGARADVDVGLS